LCFVQLGLKVKAKINPKMQDIIRLLPDAIANQIAAGEVVQRPASVVKELLENAIDASATHIQLIVREAGKNLIQVVDNGIGMSETDARMCFERHATSKIRTSEDLFTIRTMGFRGEAMASIAAVAQVEMRSRRQHDELGVLLRVEGSAFKGQEPHSCPVGTNTQVKNLFYNVPARRNFLKSNPVELKHIIDEFQRVALANPQVGFSMYHADDEVYNLPAGKLARRIIDLFGKNYEQQLANCTEHTDLLNISGYIGKPQFAKKTKSEQFFFVNGRYIKSGYLHHAIMTAYAGMLPEASHPFYVIFIEIDPKHIDINVHPTKTEIKFDDERNIYAVVSAAARKAISQYNLSPSINFDSDEPQFISQNFQKEKTMQGFSNESFVKANLNPLPKANLGNWEQLYQGLDKKTIVTQNTESQQVNVFDQTQSNFTEPSTPDTQPNSPNTTDCLQIHNQYILAQVRSGLMLIHQKNAMERISYEKLLNAYNTGKNMASQTMLFPETLSFNAADFQLIKDLDAEARILGFDFTDVGANTLIINAIPAYFTNENIKESFENLLEQFKNYRYQLKLDNKETLARAAAKRMAARYQKKLQNSEMQAIIDQLFACQNPQLTPNGEPILGIVSMEKIAQLLNEK
jgi:DNA mismatch repair protein MutL